MYEATCLFDLPGDDEPVRQTPGLESDLRAEPGLTWRRIRFAPEYFEPEALLRVPYPADRRQRVDPDEPGGLKTGEGVGRHSAGLLRTVVSVELRIIKYLIFWKVNFTTFPY